ncbi:RDD family protein [Neisseria weixii]|uniref:RDD family protein n=1 Tax=Neisseria weixii TaxID=1853276 RepID=UPI0035A16009
MNYAGFWRRTAASLIDGLILAVITLVALYMIYGEEYFTYVPEDGNFFVSFGFADIFLNYIFPIVFTLFFWLKCAATPGKMALGLKVVDVNTGENINIRQSVIRYVGYFVAMIPLCLGIFWVGFDKRKQGWHDKMAGTAVVHK